MEEAQAGPNQGAEILADASSAAAFAAVTAFDFESAVAGISRLFQGLSLHPKEDHLFDNSGALARPRPHLVAAAAWCVHASLREIGSNGWDQLASAAGESHGYCVARGLVAPLEKVANLPKEFSCFNYD